MGLCFFFELVEQAANLWMPNWVSSLRAVEALGTIHAWRCFFSVARGKCVVQNLGNDDGFEVTFVEN